MIDATLADNGGPTLTHALLPGSNAINAGSNSLSVDPGPDHIPGSGGDDVALTTDQRLTGFERIVGGRVDIGAVESLTIHVTTVADVVADDGELSLREAITQANGSAAPNEIILPSGTYRLTLTGASEDNNVSGDLDLFTDIVIRGAGAGETIIDAGGDTGIGERVMHVYGDGTVAIADVTIRGGRDDTGGGLMVRGNNGTATTLTNVVVTGNVVSGSNGGIGVFSPSTVNVLRSTISSNMAGVVGGGIGSGGRLTVSESTISGNTAAFAGGVSNFNSTLVVVNSTFSGNTAAIRAGAITSYSDGAGNR